MCACVSEGSGTITYSCAAPRAMQEATLQPCLAHSHTKATYLHEWWRTHSLPQLSVCVCHVQQCRASQRKLLHINAEAVLRLARTTCCRAFQRQLEVKAMRRQVIRLLQLLQQQRQRQQPLQGGTSGLVPGQASKAGGAQGSSRQQGSAHGEDGCGADSAVQLVMLAVADALQQLHQRRPCAMSCVAGGRQRCATAHWAMSQTPAAAALHKPLCCTEMPSRSLSLGLCR